MGLARSLYGLVCDTAPGVIPINLSATPSVVGAPISLGGSSNIQCIVIAPNQTTAYACSGLIYPIDLITFTPGQPFGGPYGEWPAMAITPDGHTLYICNIVTNAIDSFDLTSTPPTPGNSINVGKVPVAIAIAPTMYAYVCNQDDNTVSQVNLNANPAAVVSVPVGNEPCAVAIAPDGSAAYVVNGGANTVTPINLSTVPPTPGPPINVGSGPTDIAIQPDGLAAYVCNSAAGTVTQIDLSSTPPTPSPAITVGSSVFSGKSQSPENTVAIAISPSGGAAYVCNHNDATVVPIDLTTTPPSVGTAIAVGGKPQAIALVALRVISKENKDAKEFKEVKEVDVGSKPWKDYGEKTIAQEGYGGFGPFTPVGGDPALGTYVLNILERLGELESFVAEQKRAFISPEERPPVGQQIREPLPEQEAGRPATET
jgi:DNA-binding beta-propeller fold protein YncE